VVGTCGGGPGLQKAPAFPLALMHARPLPGWGWVAISKWPVLFPAHHCENSHLVSQVQAYIAYPPSLKLLAPWPDTYHVANSCTTRTITPNARRHNTQLKLLAPRTDVYHVAKSHTTPTFTPDARKSVGPLRSVYGRFTACLRLAYRGFRAASESSRYLHAAQILLSRSTPRAVIWLAYSAHRRKADIPDMLVTVPHAWTLRTVE